MVKTDFFKKNSRTLILAICYSSIQIYFKIDLIFKVLFTVDFYIENHEPFGSLTENFLLMNRNESIMSAFLVFVVFRLAVSTVKKNSLVRCLNLCQWRFVFAHLFPDISRKFTKLHLKSWRKIPPTISLYFCKLTAKVSKNSCANRH